MHSNTHYLSVRLKQLHTVQQCMQAGTPVQ